MNNRPPDAPATGLFDPFRPARHASTILIVLGLLLATMGGVAFRTVTAAWPMKLTPEQVEMMNDLQKNGMSVNVEAIQVMTAILSVVLVGTGLATVALGLLVRRGSLSWIVTALVVICLQSFVGVACTVAWSTMAPLAGVMGTIFVVATINAVKQLALAARQARFIAPSDARCRTRRSVWPAPRFHYPIARS